MLIETRMERTKADKILCSKTVGWLFFTVSLILIWCWALLWCLLGALSHMMR